LCLFAFEDRLLAFVQPSLNRYHLRYCNAQKLILSCVRLSSLQHHTIIKLSIFHKRQNPKAYIYEKEIFLMRNVTPVEIISVRSRDSFFSVYSIIASIQLEE